MTEEESFQSLRLYKWIPLEGLPSYSSCYMVMKGILLCLWGAKAPGLSQNPVRVRGAAAWARSGQAPGEYIPSHNWQQNIT